MSSTYNPSTASDNAVDGDKTDLSHTGGQCAISAVGHKTAWWWVDLGDLSSITNITIYYRTDNAAWGKQKTVLVFKIKLMPYSRNLPKSIIR